MRKLGAMKIQPDFPEVLARAGSGRVKKDTERERERESDVVIACMKRTTVSGVDA